MMLSAAERSQEVEVRTGARLHFGLFTTDASQGRLGGIGMMIDRPGFVLRASFADEDSIIADATLQQRINRYLMGLRAELQPHWPEAAAEQYRIELTQTIPSHRGFGSGTQLAFAVAAAMTRLLKFKPFVPTESLGRGERTWVGSIGFHRGGFIVDPGESGPWPLEKNADPNDRSPIVRTVPDAWRIVVVLPAQREGPSGAAELEAFRQLTSMRGEITERLGGLVSEKILPGLKRAFLPGSEQANFEAFASGITEFNRLVGEHFASVQGGTYSHPVTRELESLLQATAWPFMAQSSWGPSAAIFCESQASAESLCEFLQEHVDRNDAETFITAPRNEGAEMTLFRS